MKKWMIRFKESALWNFICKYHLLFLAIPFCIWGLKALLYNIAIWIHPHTITFHFSIDDKIPFIKYFFPFYYLYYFFPPIALWILSFYDKKKFWILLSSLLFSILVCFICYCSINVVMIRQPGYPNGIGIRDIHDISSFFDYCINWIYKKDPKAMNCFPSLHAVVGALLMQTGIFHPKKDQKHIPLFLSILFFISGFGCAISTVFIKQHYFIDLLVGVLLQFIAYPVVYFIAGFLQQKRSESWLKN